MHRCLHIVELVDIISSHLIHLPLGRRSLAALARTCKELLDPALDVLWRKQDTLRNILNCMPAGLLEIYEVPTRRATERHMRLLRPISAKDWERPLLYSQRVRTMVVEDSFDAIKLSDILHVLSACLPTGCLFPNLRTLDCSLSDQGFLYLPLFLAPTITNISFSFRPSHENLSLLPLFGRTCTRVKHLAFSPYIFAGPARVALSEFIQMFAQLESLSMDIPDLAAVEHIARLPTLTSLTVENFQGVELPPEPQAPVRRFAALKNLTLGLTRIDQAQRFLSLCSAMSIVKLDISLSTWSPTSETREMCTAIEAAFSHTFLVSLNIDNTADDPLDGDHLDAFSIDNASVRLLFCFGNLTSIYIASSAGFEFDNAIITDMARAWPHARALTLNSGSLTHPRNTLECLYPIVQYCTQLERLHITFNALAPPGAHPPRHLSQPPLKYLNVAQSPISERTLAVARVVSSLFPRLQELTTYRSGIDDMDEDDDPEPRDERHVFIDRWEEVEKHLPVLIAIRAEERAWAYEDLRA